MEYCGKAVGNNLIRKRSLRTASVSLWLVLLIGTVCELPASNFMEIHSGYGAGFEKGSQRAGTLSGTGIHTKDMKEMLANETGEVEDCVKSMEERVRQLPKVKTGSLPVFAAVENTVVDTIVVDTIADESIIDIPSEDSKAQVPALVIPPTPVKPEAPLTPGPSLIQDNTDGAGGAKEEEGPVRGEPVVQPEEFLVNEEGMIYSYNPEADLSDTSDVLELPSEGCTGILASAFAGVGTGICELYIPANITYIETGALKQLTELFGIEVSPDNPAYVSNEGVLFDSSMTTILAFPVGRIGTYKVSGSVTRLAEHSFAGSWLSVLDMRECGMVDIAGNAFEGTTLQICTPREYREQYQEMLSGSGTVVR